MEKKSKKKGKIILVIIGIVIVTVIFMIIFFAAGKNRQWQWVESTVVEATNLSREITANGEIGSRDNETLTSRMSGIIREIFVEIGDKVTAGTLIARFDNDKLLTQQQSAVVALENSRRTVKEQLLTLRTAYTQAKTGYDQAMRNYESVTQSHARGAASDEQFMVAGDTLAIAKGTLDAALQKLNFREGRAMNDSRTRPFKTDEEIINNSGEVKEAEAALNSINKSLADCEIRAGINGVITDLLVEKGSVTAPGTVIAAIHNPALLEVTANIDEVDISYVRLNQDVKVESDAFIGATLTGKVTYIAPVIKRIGDSRVCTVKASLADPEKKAKIGASCSVFIVAEKRENVPAIPIESFLQERDKKYVYKIAEPEIQSSGSTSKVVKTEIETGLMGVEKIEITNGLAAGDEIVRNNLKNLKDGDKVKIKEARKQL